MTILNNIENTSLQELPNVPGAFLRPVPMSQLQKLVGGKPKKGQEEAHGEQLVTNIFTKLIVDKDGKPFEVVDDGAVGGKRPIESHQDVMDNLGATTVANVVQDIAALSAPSGDRLGK